jgi:23S rRNA (uridine2479-2'-O)-methyltransferase
VPTTITSRNARYQQWQSLLTNRTKRQRTGEFLVHGVRPITMAVEHGWRLRALLHPTAGVRSRWAAAMLERVDAEHVAMAPELLGELAEKIDEPPELVAVAEMAPDEIDRIPESSAQLVVVFDRPTSPGNVGTLVRSVDAFGGAGVIVTGHAADVYDPKAVRASTGSLFAVPVVRAQSPEQVIAWARGRGASIVGTDESGVVRVDGYDLAGSTLLVVGNETTGMSVAWRHACDAVVRIPIGGSASSLNVACAATVVLYEAARQRGLTGPGETDLDT